MPAVFTQSTLGQEQEDKGIVVACSLPDFVPIVLEVVGERGEAFSVLPPGMDPHSFVLTSDDLNSLKNADIIVLANSKFLNFESKIRENFPNKTYVDFDDYKSHGLKLLSFPGCNNCVHGYWLYLDNAIAIARAVCDAVVNIDANYENYYCQNCDRFVNDILRTKGDIEKIADECGIAGDEVVTAVPGVNYVVENSCMIVGNTIVMEGGATPSAGRIAEIEDGLKSGKYRAIICPDINIKVCDIAMQVSEDTGAPVIRVRFLSNESTDYISMSYYNAAMLASLGTVYKGSECSLYLYSTIALTIVAIAELAILIMCRRVRRI